ncbi:7791_t:CDS:2, partial [Scutellospora calospora]
MNIETDPTTTNSETDHAIQDQVLEADNNAGYSTTSATQTKETDNWLMDIDNAIQAKVKDEFNNTIWHYD